MIMKNGKQIGFIYKNGKKIDKIIRHGKVYFEQGFVREKTDTTLPINFNGIGKDLKDYKIYGNTIQNGEPTPDASVEMISCGDRTKNLFDINEYSNAILRGGGYAVDFTKENDTTLKILNKISQVNNFCGIPIPNSKNLLGKTITASVQVELNNVDNTKMQFFFLSGSAVTNTIGTSKSITSNGTYQLTVTIPSSIPSGSTRIGLVIYGSNTAQPVNSYVLWENIQIEENSTATPYEPYGYKIPFNVRSDNLFDKDNMTLNEYIRNDGTTLSTDYWDISNYIELEPNKTYTYNGLTSIGTSSVQSAYYDINKNFISTFKQAVGTTIITTPSNAYYVRFSINKGANDKNTFQFKQGSTAPSKYIPYYNQTTNIYLDEPLRRIDGYSDYIDFKNGKVVRQLGEVILDENSTLSVIEIITSNNKFIWRYTTALDIIGSGARSNILSNNYIGDTTVYGANNKIGAYVNSNGITNFATLLSTVGATTNSTITQVLNLLKTWLSLHHTELIYPLATSTEESITLPNIPTIKGNNTLNIETEIAPSQVYIKYRSDN